MHDAWPELAADARQVGAVMQQSIHQGSIFVARGWVHRETGRLVDHDQVLVFKEHIEIHRFRLQVRQRFRRWHPQLHLIALAQGRFGLAGLAVHPHKASINELLNPGPALLGSLAHQPAIQTHRQGLGIGERHQLPLPFAEGLSEDLLWQRWPQTGNSRAMLPRADLRKSSIRRWLIRAVSAEV